MSIKQELDKRNAEMRKLMANASQWTDKDRERVAVLDKEIKNFSSQIKANANKRTD